MPRPVEIMVGFPDEDHLLLFKTVVSNGDQNLGRDGTGAASRNYNNASGETIPPKNGLSWCCGPGYCCRPHYCVPSIEQNGPDGVSLQSIRRGNH